MAVSDQQRIYAYNIADRFKLELPSLDEIPKFIEEYSEGFDFFTRIDRIHAMYEMTYRKGPESNYFFFINRLPNNGIAGGSGMPAMLFLECNLYKKSGLYAFKSIDGDILYIGKSTNLAKRIPQSYGERYSDIECEGIYVDDILYYEESEENIGVLEMYLISKYKPLFNKDGKTDRSTDLRYDLDIYRDFKPIPFTWERLEKESAKWRKYKQYV